MLPVPIPQHPQELISVDTATVLNCISDGEPTLSN